MCSSESGVEEILGAFGAMTVDVLDMSLAENNGTKGK